MQCLWQSQDNFTCWFNTIYLKRGVAVLLSRFMLKKPGISAAQLSHLAPQIRGSGTLTLTFYLRGVRAGYFCSFALSRSRYRAFHCGSLFDSGFEGNFFFPRCLVMLLKNVCEIFQQRNKCNHERQMFATLFRLQFFYFPAILASDQSGGSRWSITHGWALELMGVLGKLRIVAGVEAKQ